ncbi:RimK family protein [bacterium]|nr:RimK family protein [Candidatus Omnitrophota bacterium]MCK6496441.1 RimK family protein [bacterium]NUP93155.1 RimK family protein [Candidatus Omnitrophota bacterium]
MSILFVVNKPHNWPLEVPGVEVVSARSYLTDPRFSATRRVKVFNLCRSYRYQSMGYYVSLLASARGHRPLPSIATIQDMKSVSIIRLVSEELEDLIQSSLKPVQSGAFTLSVYFGRNLAKRYDRLSSHLFKLFQSPLLRAEFQFEQSQWHLTSIRPIPANEIPEPHRPFVIDAAKRYFENGGPAPPRKSRTRYDLAILYNPGETDPPSDPKALQKFLRAAQRLGLAAELIEKEDFGRLPEFDALFIRETTNVLHHTFRFARRAAAEGLVVIDDPDSILKCTNKVYLAELLDRHHIPTPRTIIVHRGNVDTIRDRIGLPCILKQPDSSFSKGVFKVEDPASLEERLDLLLKESDLVIAQEYLPTDFDWRVGLLDHQPLYVCKYFMAPKHWQIQRTDSIGQTRYGRVETLPVEEAPPDVVRTAIKAANLIGDGLYGVDLKQAGSKISVIEINDNPSIEAGYEDRVLREGLYTEIMSVFLSRIEQKKLPVPRED